MRCLRKTMKNLKQNFYTLKQTKMPVVVQKNMQNNAHTNQGNQSDRKRLEKKKIPRKDVLNVLKVPRFLMNTRPPRSNV